MPGSLSKKTSIPHTTLVSCFCHPLKITTNNLIMRPSLKSSNESLSGLNPMSKFLLLMMGIYRTAFTTFLGGACRFQPSCSEYAVDAIKSHSPGAAIKLIFSRLLKCHPWGPYGYDPVPERKSL